MDSPIKHAHVPTAVECKWCGTATKILYVEQHPFPRLAWRYVPFCNLECRGYYYGR